MKRDYDIQVNLEEPIYRLTVELAPKLGQSASSFVRALIVDNLRERGLLTDRILADMAAIR